MVEGDAEFKNIGALPTTHPLVGVLLRHRRLTAFLESLSPILR